ncbi:MAG: Phosphatidate cytidylyltransferase [Catillopecten margaritatus gill symbiont]|uniref:Phosphatidate cytidylyltransferase n=1 Tax=Catillopecten margaritatus gill symbiont TaxID=3083288 RepID=A0AAU6PHR2_9GAMM
MGVEMSELVKRILTASVLAFVTLWLTFNSLNGFAVLLLIAGIVVGYEFAKLSKMSLISLGLTLTFILAMPFVISMIMPANPHQNLIIALVLSVVAILVLSVIFWLKNLYLVVNYPNKKPSNSTLNQVVSLFLLLVPILSLPFIQHFDIDLLMLLFIIVWGADSFAYFSGKAFGKNKLAPNLSGGKTIEGVAGGLVGVLLMTGVWMVVTENLNGSFLVLAFITGIFSVIGDLYESIYKREAGVKDSGNILPGHGGLFDRLDGLLAATPVFMLGTYLLGMSLA